MRELLFFANPFLYPPPPPFFFFYSGREGAPRAAPPAPTVLCESEFSSWHRQPLNWEAWAELLAPPPRAQWRRRASTCNTGTIRCKAWGAKGDRGCLLTVALGVSNMMCKLHMSPVLLLPLCSGGSATWLATKGGSALAAAGP